MLRLYDLMDFLMPGQFEGFGYRKIFVQKQVEAAIKKGVRQVLVVGAGFDTLCLRLAPQYAQLQFFEIDHPATAEAKRKGIVLEGQPTNMVQIAADLGELPLSRVLSGQDRWETSAPSVLVAEGLFQYLSDEGVRGLLVEAAACTSLGSRFVFTHAIPGNRRFVSILTHLIAEPWKSVVRSEDLPEYVEGTGWTIISEVDTDASHGVERYGVAERR
jgi:methyltransferase (TIGR00027 family)